MAKHSRTVQIKDLGTAITQELNVWHQDVVDAVDAASFDAVKALVKQTRATAPKGARGSFKKNISSKQVQKTRRGVVYAWYVKPPDYRLTHLLVHGHETRDGGRTRPDPFLKNALDDVLPAYQKRIEEALKNGK